MASNQYVNKVVYGGETLIDLTSDTVDAAHLLKNITAHDKSGAPVTGACEYDAKTTDATAVASEILSSKTAYVNKAKVTGTMANNGSNNVTVASKAGASIPAGYYDGSGKAVLDSSSASALVATNIRQGVTILGTEQTVTEASEDLDYITQVTVAAIPYTETDNAQGGKTVVIAAAA